MEHRNLALVAFLGIYTSLSSFTAAEYKHLGCFVDQSANKDLTGKDATFSDLTVEKCTQMCREEGYPYAGLQEGALCFCGMTYGEYGLTNANACNYTCDGKSCGGHLANDIYYAVDTSAVNAALRKLYYFKETRNFNEARRECVKADGDLVVMPDKAYKDEAMQTASSSGNAQSFWVGLRKKMYEAEDTFRWTDPSVEPYSDNGNASSFWSPTVTQRPNDCVMLFIQDGYWQSTSCMTPQSYVCNQKPPVRAEESKVLALVSSFPVKRRKREATQAPTTTKSSDADEGGFDKTKLSLYVVLPLFLFCYGGSCVLYCGSKLHKAFKRRKRQKMMLAKIDTLPEYEPDTKPGKGSLNPPAGHSGRSTPRPLSAGKSAKVHPAMTPGRPGSKPMYHHPPRGAGPPPPPISYPRPTPAPSRMTPVSLSQAPPASGPRPDTKTSQNDDESRPATSRAVEISMKESAASLGTHDHSDAGTPTAPAPRASAHRSKDDIKKAKLLENALKEARGRRRQERIARGEDPDSRPTTAVTETPSPAPASETEMKKKKKKREGADEVSDGRQSKREKSRERQKSAVYGDAQDSGDSTTNLLADIDKPDSPSNETPAPPRDPTKMSIQDILRAKMAMRNAHRKPKKIMTA